MLPQLHTEPLAGAEHHLPMVGVAQLVERWLVTPEVAGSNPVAHPNEIPMSLDLYDRTHMCQHHGLLGPVRVDGCRVCYRCGSAVEFTKPARSASRPVDLHGQVAQLVEHRIEDPSVVGSTPTLTTTSAQVAQSVERRPEKASVGGSIPSLGTKRKRRFTI